MKIALVSDHETLGGAAQAAARLARGLCEQDEVDRIVLHPDGMGHPWRTLALVRDEPWLRRQLYRLPRRLCPGRFPRPATPAFAARALNQALRHARPDVINIHNLHGGTAWGWGPELVACARRVAPVVWTLHDMWSFTARCAYSYDCHRFTTGCTSDCPTADESPRLPRTDIPAAWQARQRLLGADPELVAVTPSRWLAKEATRGLWAHHRIEVIPYGVPTHIYRPLPRRQARRCLGLPEDGSMMLIAAVDLTERRKGAALLANVWPHLRATSLPGDVTVLTMGRGELNAPSGTRIVNLGWIDDEQARALAYNAADLLLHPAPVDNLPNVVLEALASGTPTVALPVGGVPEMVRPGLTGWLAAEATGADFGAAVARALAQQAAGLDLRASCRQVAEAEYGLERQTSRYRALFEQLQSEPRRRTIDPAACAAETSSGRTP